jgi:ferredoxin
VHVQVNPAKCISSGQCVLNAPEVFDQREDDGTVALLDDSPTAEHQDAVREAAMVCPSGAVTSPDRQLAGGNQRPVPPSAA